jgi:nucleoside-diphosphate-sugar epimerase
MFHMSENILLTGAGGQIGIELTARLRKRFGRDAVLATDLQSSPSLLQEGPFEQLDVTDEKALRSLFDRFKPTQVYHLASLLSATSERKPKLAWEVNVNGLLYVLEACREYNARLFWPSSIAVFGPGTPRYQTPQQTIIDPTTIYGIGKLTGERWCAYYKQKHGLDVRSLRYPGLISYAAMPGGGTTDYAVDIFFQAVEHAAYTCFLGPETELPMMFMDDAIRGTLELMDADMAGIKTTDAYNFAAITFTPAELGQAIQRFMPDFKLDYQLDERQAIADSWPASIDDQAARSEWGWKPAYDLEGIVKAMLAGVREKLGVKA